MKNKYDFIEKLIILRQDMKYLFILFGINFILWYVMFNKLNLEDLAFLSFLSTILEDNFLAIFTNLPHSKIPNSYPNWVRVVTRIVVFLFILFVLFHFIPL